MQAQMIATLSSTADHVEETAPVPRPSSQTKCSSAAAKEKDLQDRSLLTTAIDTARRRMILMQVTLNRIPVSLSMK